MTGHWSDTRTYARQGRAVPGASLVPPLTATATARSHTCTACHRPGVNRGPRDVGVVVSIGKLGGGQRSERYYTNAVASGREDYYSGRGEASGQWHGTGADELRLSGRVEADALSAATRDATRRRAPACRQRRRCDLSRGVVADDRAGTVAFHLSAPEPEFLYTLTLPYAHVMPATMPSREARPAPGHGALPHHRLHARARDPLRLQP